MVVVLISVSMLGHTEGSVIQRPSCFESPCKLLCGVAVEMKILKELVFPLTQDSLLFPAVLGP